jgi:hypothetical protein
MRPVRAITFGVLALLLAVTTFGTASARGAMAADGVICGTGGGAVVMAADGLPLFDGTGTPVDLASAPCLDCVFGAMALAAGPQRAGVAALPTTLSATRHTGPAIRVWLMGGKGRSPPAAG